MNFNTVVIAGNLTRDPEVRYLQNGTAVCESTIAINEKYKDKVDTCFIDVTVWSKQAEIFCEYLKKGDPCLVRGRLKQDKWQTAEGKNVSKIRVTVDEFQMFPKKNGVVKDRPEPTTTDEVEGNPNDIPF